MARRKPLLGVTAACFVLSLLAGEAALGRAGEVVDIPAIIDTALHGIGEERVKAIHKLSALPADKIRQFKIVDVLLKKLALDNNVGRRIREAAIDDLGRLVGQTFPEAKPQVLPELQRALKDSRQDILVRKGACRALGKIVDIDEVGDTPSLRTLEALAANSREDSGLRAVAFIQLGEIGHPDSREVIRAGLSDKSPDIRDAASQALQRVLRGTTGKMGTAEVGIYLKLAKDKTIDAKIRINMIKALGRAKGNRLVPKALTNILTTDEDPDILIAATQSLARLRDVASIKALVSTYDKNNKGKGSALVRGAVCEALGEFYEALASSRTGASASSAATLATKTLVKALQDDADPEVWKKAAWALGNIPKKYDRSDPVAILIEAMTENDTGLQKVCQDSLRVLTDREFGKDLEKWRAWYRKNKSSLRPRFR